MSEIRKIAVLTSGGDAPGMNAAIRAVVRCASYHKLIVMGIVRGYEGMIKGDFIPMNSRSVGNILHRGGTVLKTARSEQFRTAEGRKQAYDMLMSEGIDGVIAIGGNGTFTGADIFMKEYNIPFIGIPGTIDNDLWGTDLTIGFDTAVNTAIEAVDRIRDTADSHDRIFFVEVMGRHAGFIALNAGIGTGAENILLPEIETSTEDLVKQLTKSIKRGKLFNLVLVAEGNPQGGAYKVAEEVMKHLPQADIKVTVIGHLQRGGAPTALDRVLASRMGYTAVEALINGMEGVMVGYVNRNMVFVPFDDAINKHKVVDPALVEMAKVLAL